MDIKAFRKEIEKAIEIDEKNLKLIAKNNKPDFESYLDGRISGLRLSLSILYELGDL